MPISSSPSSTFNNRAAQRPRPSVQSEQNAGPVDERVLRLLEAYRPWDALDGMALTIIDQTYAALVQILGLDAPPLGGRPVKASHLVEPTDDDPHLSPVLVVVEASATHCSVRLIDGAAGAGARPDHESDRHVHGSLKQAAPAAIRPRQHGPIRRATVNVSPGTIHLARASAAAAAAGDDNNDGGRGDNRWKNAVGDLRPDVAEKGLLGVLDAMRSHVNTAIRLEDGVIDMARAGGCRRRTRAEDIVRVRMLLGQVRHELDLDAVMRRFRSDRWDTQVINRRRPAAEMDVDKVDVEDAVMKKLKGLHVMGNNSSEAAHGEQGNGDALQSIESIVTAKLCLD
ncbi:unnamed protein product [Urochloa humidicola]